MTSLFIREIRYKYIIYILLSLINCPNNEFDIKKCSNYSKVNQLSGRGLYINFLLHEVSFNYESENAMQKFYETENSFIEPLVTKHVYISYIFGNFTDDIGLLWSFNNVKEFLNKALYTSDFFNINKEYYSDKIIQLFHSTIVLEKNCYNKQNILHENLRCPSYFG